MPVAAVEKHRDSNLWEYQISSAPNAGYRPHSDPIAKAEAVDRTTQREFGDRVPTTVTLHASAG
jgi:hypothetical protein